LSIRFRAEVDVWVNENLMDYVGTASTSTSMLNELAKQQVAREIQMSLDAYGLTSNVASVAKTTK
jgi:hypothetical protein